MSDNKDRRVMLTFKQETEQSCIKFIEMQDNYTNAIRYLILKEIKENGYRNLNKFIPAQVTEDYFNYNYSAPKNTNTNFQPITDSLKKDESLSKVNIETNVTKQNSSKKELSKEVNNKPNNQGVEIPSCFDNIED